MVDPAANMLVDKASLQSFVTVSSLTAASSHAPAVVEDPAALPTVTGLQSPVNSHRSSVTGQRETAAPSSPPGRWSGLLFPQSLVHSHRSSVTGQWPRRRCRPRFQRRAWKDCWRIFQLWSTAPRRCRGSHPGTWSIISSPRGRRWRAASAALTAKSWPRRKRSSCRWRKTASSAALTALGPPPCRWCKNQMAAGGRAVTTGD
jgi:hypothetical protein